MDRTLTLTIKVVADTAKKALDSVKKNVDGVSKSADSVRKRFAAFGKGLVGLGKRVVKLATSLQALVAAFAALAVVQQITGYFTSLTTTITEMGNVARETGVELETISGLFSSAQFLGFPADEIAPAFRTLAVEIGLAKVEGEELFNTIGLSVRKAGGEFKTTQEVLFDYADLIKNTASTSEKAAKAAKIFGEDAGPKLVNFLNLGSEGLRRYISEAERFGVVFGDEQSKKIQTLVDSFAKLGLAIRGVFTQALLGIADQLSRRIDAITALILELGPVISKVFQDAFNSVSRFTEGAGNLFARLFSSEGREELLNAVTSALTEIDNRIKSFSANVRALAMATFDVIKFGLTDAFTDALANVTLQLKETSSTIASSFGENSDLVKGLGAGFLAQFGGTLRGVEAVSQTLSASLDVAASDGEQLANAMERVSQLSGNLFAQEGEPTPIFGELSKLMETGQMTQAIELVRQYFTAVQQGSASVQQSAQTNRSFADSIRAVAEAVGTEFKTGLENAGTSLVSFNSSVTGVFTNAKNSAAGFFETIIRGGEAKDAFKQFVASVVNSLVSLAAQIIVVIGLLLILNAIPGGAAVATALGLASQGASAGTTAATPTPQFEGPPAPGGAIIGENFGGANFTAPIPSGGSSGRTGPTNININAIDAQSFAGFLSNPRNRQSVQNAAGAPRV